jgi:hypothetical protein
MGWVLAGALEVATGLVHSGHYRRRRRREFLDFMNELVSIYTYYAFNCK